MEIDMYGFIFMLSCYAAYNTYVELEKRRFFYMTISMFAAEVGFGVLLLKIALFALSMPA